MSEEKVDIKVTRKKLADYVQNPKNPVEHNPYNLGVVVDSIHKVGAFRSGAASKGKILAGNLTWEAMAEAGIEDVIEITTDGKTWVIVNREDLTPEQEKEAAYYDQRAGELANWNFDQIMEDIDKGVDLSGLFSTDDLDEMLAALDFEDLPDDPGVDIGRAGELRQVWQTAVGQLWELGEHRLIIGDCTDPEVVESVMRGERANLLFTSPPYWVGMEYEREQSEAEIDAFIKNCVRAWTDAVDVDCGRVVINTGTAAIHRVEKGRKVEVLPLVFKWQQELRQRGWLARHYRVWVKRGGFGRGRISPKGDAIDQHWETITEFVHEEAEFLGTFWAPSGQQRGQEKIGTKWAQQGVWTEVITGVHGAKTGSGHVAAFPLEIPERHIRLYTKIGELVFEPFVGSGTTAIGCERLSRRCRAIEIDPGYAAIAIQRWADLTKKQPQLLT